MSVEAIKDIKKIDDLLLYLRKKDERNYLLCKFQLNTGLRIGDVVRVKVGDIFDEIGEFRDYFSLIEQKSNKDKKIRLNEELKIALKSYLLVDDISQDEYIFKSRISSERGYISTTQAYRILKEGANAVGIENFGTHSLRKTWGYFIYKASNFNIGLVAKMFNHSSESTTLRYIGIDQDERDKLYTLVQF